MNTTNTVNTTIETIIDKYTICVVTKGDLIKFVRAGFELSGEGFNGEFNNSTDEYVQKCINNAVEEVCNSIGFNDKVEEEIK